MFFRTSLENLCKIHRIITAIKISSSGPKPSALLKKKIYKRAALNLSNPYIHSVFGDLVTLLTRIICFSALRTRLTTSLLSYFISTPILTVQINSKSLLRKLQTLLGIRQLFVPFFCSLVITLLHNK